jgi:hypothetical protein
MISKRIAAGGLVAGVCALAGTLGGIASGSAATKTKTHSTAQGAPAPGPGGPGRFGGGPAIHSVSVQLNQARTGYVTVTTDSGTVQSVDTSGDTVTVVEGLSSSPYKTATISVPSGATIQLDGKTSTLSALAAGDHVTISSSSDGTTNVFATDSSFTPPQGHGAPGGAGPGSPGGPPPWSSGSSSSTSTSTTSTASSSS